MDEERIRLRAYSIWESEGHPEGRHDAHWEQARRELEAEDAAPAWTGEGAGSGTGGEAAAGGPDTLHPSGRNAGGLRPAAEAMGNVEGGSARETGGGAGGDRQGMREG